MRAAPLLVGLSLSFCFCGHNPTIAAEPEWSRVEDETMRHFQALLRIDTTKEETAAAEYVKTTLEREGVPVQIFAKDPKRPNVVARLRGSGKKRPVVVMAHLDVVGVELDKWKHPPFSATREGGYVYGRGAVDDKDQVAAGMMLMLMLKRSNTKLDRDVVFVAEAAEEGTPSLGMKYLVDEHLADVQGEYCFAEGGAVLRANGKPWYGLVELEEKIPHTIELKAKGIAGHGSVPTKTNAIVHLGAALAKLGSWSGPFTLDDVTRSFFDRLATVSPAAEAERYRGVLDPKRASEADAQLWAQEPRYAAMLHSTVNATMLKGGFRDNVIPSEATARLDTRLLPGEDPAAFLEKVRAVVDDKTVSVEYAEREARPPTTSRIDTEAFRVLEKGIKKHYEVIAIPSISPATTDMPFLRAKGAQCYGWGPAIDREDIVKGFFAHGDQERILEAELHRFVKLQWDVITELARGK